MIVKRDTWENGIYHERRYDFSKSSDVARYVAQQRFAWPGGYALFAITDDGGVLCADCCRNEYVTIREAYRGDGWFCEAADCMANVDYEPDEFRCSHCSEVIE